MEFHVLGPVGVSDQGSARRLRPRSAALLAVFLLQPNRPVSRDTLIDRLWPDGAAPGAAGSLNVHLHRLRQELGDGGVGVSRLASSVYGYTLVVEQDELDSHRFAAHVERARRLLPTHPTGAVADADAALALWRGRPFGELDEIEGIGAVRAALESLRGEALCLLADALWAAGDVSRLVADAPRWLDALPYSEHLAGRLALGLYARGDQVAALRWCREFGDRLGEDLGLDPTPAFRSIEQAILTHAVSDPLPSRAAAATLPGLVERDGVFAEVEGAIDLAVATQRVVTLWGEAGVGKTTLLRSVADRHRDAPVVWSAGDGEPLSAVRSLAAQVAADAELPADRHPDALAAWLVRLLTDAAVRLVLWDDVHRADEDSVAIVRRVAQRLPLTWVTTTRSRDLRLHPLLGDRSLLASAVSVEVPPLSLAGLAGLAGGLDVDLDGPELDALLAQTGGNPFLAQALLRSPDWRRGGMTPVTATEHIRRLVGELGPEAPEWFSLAALDVGDEVDIRALCHATGLGVSRGVEVAEAGLAVGLLTEHHGTLRFRHALVPESLVAGMSSPRRQTLHERLARELLDIPGTPVRRVAHHLRACHAEPLRRTAAEFTARQAAQELAGGAPQAAAEHYGEAAELIEALDATQAGSWRLDACDALVLAGRTLDSQDLAASVAERARRALDRAQFVGATVRVCGPYLAIGDSATRASDHLLEAIEWCQADGVALPADLCEAVARQTTDRVDVAAGRMRDAVRPHLERYSEVGSPRERYLGLAGRRQLGWVDDMALAERRRLLSDCLRLSVSSNSVTNELRTRWGLASDAFLAADANASDVVRAYADRADEVGSPMHRWVSGRLALAVAGAVGSEDGVPEYRARIDDAASFVDPAVNERADLLLVLDDAVRTHQLAPLLAIADSVDLGDDVTEFVPLLELARLAIRRAAGIAVDPSDVNRYLVAGGHGTVRCAACALATLCIEPDGGEEVARTVIEWLSPWSDTMVLLESGFATLGPADAYLARCATVLNDPSQRDYYFARSQQVTRRFADSWAGWCVKGG